MYFCKIASFGYISNYMLGDKNAIKMQSEFLFVNFESMLTRLYFRSKIYLEAFLSMKKRKKKNAL